MARYPYSGRRTCTGLITWLDFFFFLFWKLNLLCVDHIARYPFSGKGTDWFGHMTWYPYSGRGTYSGLDIWLDILIQAEELTGLDIWLDILIQAEELTLVWTYDWISLFRQRNWLVWTYDWISLFRQRNLNWFRNIARYPCSGKGAYSGLDIWLDILIQAEELTLV